VPIHHAVLAILAGGPSHGYELKATFEEAIGPQWGELNIGHLYQVLDRLVRDGLVTRRPVPQRGRPNRIDYRLTKAGRRELEEWLKAPFVSQGGYRDELFLKIFASARVGGEQLRQTIRVQRQAYMSELSALGKLRKQHRNEPLVSLLIEAAVLHTGANVRVLDAAEERIDQLASARSVAQAEQKEIKQAQ
jgi:DNA-binding PadR family transcriptional regulator